MTANMDDDELQLRYVRVPKGQHLSDSRDTDGWGRDLLRDDGTNELRGPAESLPVDEDELRERLGVRSPDGEESSTDEDRLSPGQQALADVVLHIIDEVLEQVDWDAVFAAVWPAVRRAPRRVFDRLRFGKARAAQQPGWGVGKTTGEVNVAAVESPRSIDRPTSRVVMSSEEYRRLLLEIMAAEAFASKRRTLLSNVVVDDRMITPELMNSMRLVLDGRALELSDTEVAAVLAFLQITSPVPNGRALGSGRPAAGRELGHTPAIGSAHLNKSPNVRKPVD